MNKTIRIVITGLWVLILSANPVQASLPHFEGSIVFPGNNLWDYAPSWMVDQFDSSKEKLWWCSQKSTSEGVDVIRYSVRNPGGSWSTPQIVFQHVASAPSWEGQHVCDPSVVRGAFSVRLNGPSDPLVNFSYAMYYTTNDPTTTGSNNRVGVAFSNDGVNWQRYYAWVVYHAFSSGYGTGTQIAFSANGAASVNMVYMFVNNAGVPKYFYRQSTDAVAFGVPITVSTSGLTLNGVPGIPVLGPALAFAPVVVGNVYYYYLANVCETYGNNHPKRICAYRMPMASLSSGTWERVVDPGDVKPVQFEPGFKADAWGWMSSFLNPITIGMGCSGAYGQGYEWSYELCYATAVP